MVFILEGIFKGFVQWVYSLCLEMVQYIANSLLEVFQMDLSYFRQVAPVTDDILSIVIAVGWALLLGNLVFQAMKSMVIGLGFEGEDPKLLFTRTFVFAFLLLVSQQICEIGLGISSQVIALLQVPTSVTITIPDENNFTIGASWLLIIIVGIVVMWQFVKLCFEVAERYVVTAILVLMAPLAFGMGGSKNTEDIFKGWCRMFGSMCVMMIMNVIFLKLLISALGYVPSGVAVLPWMLLAEVLAALAPRLELPAQDNRQEHRRTPVLLLLKAECMLPNRLCRASPPRWMKPRQRAAMQRGLNNRPLNTRAVRRRRSIHMGHDAVLFPRRQGGPVPLLPIPPPLSGQAG